MEYDVTMEVLSFSVEEDWVSGRSVVPVTYSAPYSKKFAFFPADTTTNYVASPETAAQLQPYTAVPWVATFAGCCRRYASPDGVWSFNVSTYVDLTNNLGSPRIVTMPQVWLAQATQGTPLYLCAIAVAGAGSMKLMSGGTLNYPRDDNTPAKMEWEVIGYSFLANDGASVAIQPPVGVELEDQDCIRFCFSGIAPDATGYIGYLTVGCSIGTGCALGGCSLVTADIALNTYPMATVASGAEPLAAAGSPFRCNNLCSNPASRPPVDPDYVCNTLVSAGSSLASGFSGTNRLSVTDGGLLLAAYSSTVKPLELRYVIATRDRQSGLLATAQGRDRYALSDAAADNAGLPPGMNLSATSGVHDIQVRPDIECCTLWPKNYLAQRDALARMALNRKFQTPLKPFPLTQSLSELIGV